MKASTQPPPSPTPQIEAASIGKGTVAMGQARSTKAAAICIASTKCNRATQARSGGAAATIASLPVYGCTMPSRAKTTTGPGKRAASATHCRPCQPMRRASGNCVAPMREMKNAIAVKPTISTRIDAPIGTPSL